MSISMTTTSIPFWKEYPERDSEWGRQYPTRHVPLSEEEVFSPLPMGVYIHIPFCNKLCFSCPYTKYQTTRPLATAFLDALMAEIDNYASRPYVQDRHLVLGYIGGGAPTALTAAQLDGLLRHLFSSIPCAQDVDFSIESTPVDINERKCQVLLKHGINRISLGIQTFDRDELKNLGRPSDPEMLKDCIRMLQRCGFKNVNIDLMYGINGQTMASWERSLDTAIELGVTCVSLYTYMEFAQITTKRRKLPPIPNSRLVDEMFMVAAEKLTANGFLGYYGDCFAKPGYQPHYGEVSWSENVPIIPLGPTAAGHLRDHWWFNEPDIHRYIEIATSGRLPISMGRFITKEEGIRRSMVLGVKAGRVDRDRFRSLHGVDFMETFSEELEDFESKGLVILSDTGLKISGPKGLFYLDNISKAFYSPEHRYYPKHLGSDISAFIGSNMRKYPQTEVLDVETQRHSKDATNQNFELKGGCGMNENRLLDLAERVPLTSPFADLNSVRAYDLGMRRSALMAYKEPAERIISHVTPNTTEMVEIGCNTGLLGLHLAGRLPKVQISGFEEIGNLVEVAEDNLTLAVWANAEGDLDFEKTRLHRLPLPDNSADIVYSFSSLHRWLRPVETLREAARICRPDGIVIIHDSNRHADEGHITFILQFIKDGADQFMHQLQSAYTRDEAEQLLAEAGLDGWQVREEDLGLVISSRPLEG